ncbi:MAG: hypothetical protein JW827_08705 [Spirochaetes bacterium]|nr:hypothetical protein [Spirochaetota bacterium]
MKRSIISLLILFLMVPALGAEEFNTQQDSFFASSRPRVLWAVGTSFSMGSGFGYGNGTMGMGNLCIIRLVSKIRPRPLIFEYLWLGINEGYSLYEDEKNIDELIPFYGSLGVGFNIGKRSFPFNFIPYLGFGMGGVAGFNRTGVDTDNVNVTDFSPQVMYTQIFGLEWYVSQEIAVFIEQRYLWAWLLSNEEEFIPEWHDTSNRSIIEGSYSKEESLIRQFSISLGVTFYWIP